MEPRISPITLGTRDPARATRFYRDGLGWPLARDSGGDVAFFRGGGVVLALYPRDLPARDAQAGQAGTGFGGSRWRTMSEVASRSTRCWPRRSRRARRC